ncbi:hypothetical protein C7413_10653 [Paraburkholderia silvatlantica]|nr:hypothetical protein C7411_10653 [Paraburkholderia silvatlantica]PXW39280.1 hypothetical protein C7413_10653 [Paraburkholderia silvatlantica]
MQLASRFASRSPVLRSEHPLSDDQIRAVAPSIFADAPHESRSQPRPHNPSATSPTTKPPSTYDCHRARSKSSA